jgi:hypothetical protein
MNASAVVLDALAQARWREIYIWLTANPAETLAGQMKQLGVPAEKLLAVAAAMDDSGEPVAPPRSWCAEDRAAFGVLPRGVQAAIARREAERDKALRRLQNETAELRKKTAPSASSTASAEPINAATKD